MQLYIFGVQEHRCTSEHYVVVDNRDNFHISRQQNCSYGAAIQDQASIVEQRFCFAMVLQQKSLKFSVKPSLSGWQCCIWCRGVCQDSMETVVFFEVFAKSTSISSYLDFKKTSIFITIWNLCFSMLISRVDFRFRSLCPPRFGNRSFLKPSIKTSILNRCFCKPPK